MQIKFNCWRRNKYSVIIYDHKYDANKEKMSKREYFEYYKEICEMSQNTQKMTTDEPYV